MPTNPLLTIINDGDKEFDEKFNVNLDEWPYIHTKEIEQVPSPNEVKSFLTTSQISLLQTAIAAVEGMKGTMDKSTSQSQYNFDAIWNSALSKVVELLKGGIEGN